MLEIKCPTLILKGVKGERLTQYAHGGMGKKNQGSAFTRKSEEQLLVGEVFTICHFSPSTF